MIWKGPKREEKTIYLTFDDGPVPEATPWVLDVLKSYGAKATFFCVGENVRKHPEIYLRILEEGHTVGNHTHTHQSGYHCSIEEYKEEVKNASAYINSSLFRPPYGKIKRSQRKMINNTYDIIMWDVLSGDFDVKISADRCKKNVLNHIQDRSIVVFHDSVKAMPRLRGCLEEILAEINLRGFQCVPLEAGTFAERHKTEI
ncbi:MAG: polysaccharide deacetylase family protein [Saprospiraceae bacterium]|nr:polysaccharide deacetylase family protein [Saprospiraceae bacterium]